MLLGVLFVLCLFPLTKSACTQNTNGCRICYSYSICLYCQSGYFLLNSQCVDCSDNCLECFSPSVCTKCSNSFVLNTARTCQCPPGRGLNISTGVCEKCSDPLCTQCNANNTMCTQCSNGQSPSSSYACARTCTDPNCGVCQANVNACTACNMGYGLNLTSSFMCTQCQMSNCKRCDKSMDKCIFCVQGYGVDPVSNKCIQCNTTIPDCLECGSSTSHCTRCSDGYGPNLDYRNQSWCLPCSIPSCTLCSYDYKKCQECQSPFTLFYVQASAVISNLNYSQYYYYCSNCAQFVDKCAVCDSTGSVCLQCMQGYGVYSISNTCKRCNNVYCRNCSFDYSNCLECQHGSGKYNGNSNICVQCDNNLWCFDCQQNKNICTEYTNGYYNNLTDSQICNSRGSYCQSCDSTKSVCYKCFYSKLGIYNPTSPNPCASCKYQYCLYCSFNYQVCTECPSFLSPDGYGNCVTFNDTNCEYAPTSPSVCQYCSRGYGVSPSSYECVGCSDPNCVYCGYSWDMCQVCTQVYYPLPDGTCAVCSSSMSKCIMCRSKTVCTYCEYGYGVHPSTNTCVGCISHCANCSTNIYYCTNCTSGYYRTYTYTCVQCPSPTTCIQCTDIYATCTKCVWGYGLQSGSNCVPCASSNCLTCNQSFINHCYTCNASWYLQDVPYFTYTYTRCRQCGAHCLQCDNGTSCNQAQYGYWWNTNASTGSQCHYGCLQCQYYETGYDTCLVCNDTFVMKNISGRIVCKEICGDYVAYNYTNQPCDLGLDILYDGCTDDCQVQTDFVCLNHSFCQYTGTITFQLLKVERNKDVENNIYLTVSVFPPLFAFRNQDLMKLFVISDSDVSVTKIQFDQLQQKLVFSCDFAADLNEKSSFTILYFPNATNNTRLQLSSQNNELLLTPVFTSYLPFYYTFFSQLTAHIVKYVTYVNVILMFVSLFLGLFLRRLCGLQSAFVMQFAFVNVLFFNTYLYAQLQSAAFFKFANGFAFPIISESLHNFAFSSPFANQLNMKVEHFVNMYNLSFLLQFILLVTVLVCFVRIKLYLKSEEYYQILQQQKINTMNKPQRQKQLQKYFETFCQFLLTITVFNLISLVVSFVLFMQNDPFSSAADFVAFVLCSLVSLSVFGMFLFAPDNFGYFRYSFRYTAKSCLHQLIFKHFVIFTFVVTLSVLTLILFPKIIFVSSSVLFAFLLYNLVVRPYKHKLENVRSFLCIFAMCSISSIRIYANFKQKPFHNETIFNVLILLSFCAFPLLCNILAIVSMSYEKYYITYIKPQEDVVDLQYLAKQAKNKVYQQLEQIDLTAPISNIDDVTNVFRKVSKKQKKIIDYSHQLDKQVFNSQRQFLANWTSQQNKIQPEKELKKRQSNNNSEKQQKSSEKSKDNSKQQQTKQIQSRDESLKESVSQKQRQQQQKRQYLKDKKLAKQVLIEEKDYVGLRYLHFFKKESPQKYYENQNLRAYESIQQAHKIDKNIQNKQ